MIEPCPICGNPIHDNQVVLDARPTPWELLWLALAERFGAETSEPSEAVYGHYDCVIEQLERAA